MTLIATLRTSDEPTAQSVNFEDDQFIVDGQGALSASDLLRYHDQGLLEWVSEEMHAAAVRAAVFEERIANGPWLTEGCDSCRYALPVSVLSEDVQCRRYPPSASREASDQTSSAKAVFPEVHYLAWCGEYQSISRDAHGNQVPSQSEI